MKRKKPVDTCLPFKKTFNQGLNSGTWSNRSRGCGLGQQVVSELVDIDKAMDSLERISTDVSERGTGPTCPTVAPPCQQGQVRQVGDFVASQGC